MPPSQGELRLQKSPPARGSSQSRIAPVSTRLFQQESEHLHLVLGLVHGSLFFADFGQVLASTIARCKPSEPVRDRDAHSHSFATSKARYSRRMMMESWRLGLKSGAFVDGLGLLAQLGSFEHHRHELVAAVCHRSWTRCTGSSRSLHFVSPVPSNLQLDSLLFYAARVRGALRALRLPERQAGPGLLGPGISRSRAGDRDEAFAWRASGGFHPMQGGPEA